MSTNLKQMREKVLRELEYIPKSSKPQSELRLIYWSRRMNSLGKKAKDKLTANEVLQECIKSLRKDYPSFEFEYDEKFFI